MTTSISTPQRIDLAPLQEQLAAEGYDVSNGIGSDDMRANDVYTYDEDGAPLALPAEAQPIIDSYLDEAREAPSFDSLEVIKTMPRDATNEEFRDAIVAYLEAHR
jgi:hypothetical protein